jgi:glycosyltransferase involved in cell wall biosynthesis
MGGAEFQAKLFIENLIQSEGIQVYYLARRFDPRLRPKGYRIIQISAGNGIRRYGFFLDSFRLLKLLRKINPHYIYQRVGCGYTGIAAYYARRNDCKMVWHISSDSDVLPLQRIPLGRINLYIEKKFLEYGVRYSDDIIAQTRSQAEYLKVNYGKSPTEIIPNFHPLPREQINKVNPIKILWISNFKPLKQPEYFIRLARDLGDSHAGILCLMIGAPSIWHTRWQRSLQKEIDKIDYLEYLGAQSIEEVNTHLAQSHILVNTSRYEGLSNTFIQAWMRRVPVVSLFADPERLLSESFLGFVCGSYDGMLENVIELINNPTLREKIGGAAQAFAFEKYSEKNLTRLIEIVRT